ncbi:hypothetical protein BDP27DRAFT_1206831 [Rhodocollybia butyracea]|uniref:Response regulatory domain-containing protein n=1 Tax=Rhodocollybia butyracea TaxID=206335 RepID=A0A9P5UGE2_9AGAR|nr:hypothetical protein BDP27DRAFT_1206831 [Rhodocollybia butyracea]
MAANAQQEQEQEQEQHQDLQPDSGGGSWNLVLPNVPPLSNSASQGLPVPSQSLSQQERQPSSPLSMLNPFSDYTSDHEGLEVYTVGHLMPKGAIDDMSGTWNFDAGMFGGASRPDLLSTSQLDSSVGGQERRSDGGSSAMTSASTPGFESSSSSVLMDARSGSNTLRVRRSTFVPGWAVSPRVLLVDDDAVSRKLSSKFLQVFGCKIDVAVDGVGAVNKMNLEKYDLVLMDIVMPKLDGVSATSLIRKFDHMTPIISMTSNSKPNEIMTYYHSGMNDILPKPFTKQGLLDMLEKHLMHLKVIQQMSRVPRSVGIPPLSDSAFEEAITSRAALIARQSYNNSSTSNDLSTDDDDMGRLNPLAGMGLTDEQYSTILSGIVNGETFAGSMDMGGYGNDTASFGGMGLDVQKRRLDDEDDGRDTKRSRFEVIE